MHFGGDMKPFRMKENSYIERIDSFNVRIRVMYCLSERALFMKELFPLKQSARVCYSVFARFDEGPSHILEIPPVWWMYLRWGGVFSGEGASICLANNGVAVGNTRG